MEAELERAPAFVRELHAELLVLAPTPQPLTSEANTLAARYAARGIVGPKFRHDLLHVALATVADADVIVSWNFRHIVHFDKIRAFNAVNLETGYKPLAIDVRRRLAELPPGRQMFVLHSRGAVARFLTGLQRAAAERPS